MNPKDTTKTGYATTSPQTQNVTTQGTVTPAGLVNYDPNTGKKLAPGQSVVVAPGGNTYGSTAQSLTTLSSNKNADIVANNQKLEQMSNKGVQTDTSTGVATYPDGTAYQPTPSYPTDPTFIGQLQRDTTEIKTVVNNPDGSRTVYFKDGNAQQISRDPNAPTTVDNDAEINGILNQMREQSDAITSTQIAEIQQKYAKLKEQQKKINASREAATKGALFRSGAAEHDAYAQRTAQEEVQRSAEAIADLEAEEQTLINQAKAAQATNNFKILEKSLAQAEAKRAEKLKATEELNKQLLEAEKKAREQLIQSSRDDAVASLFSQGVTDVSSMLDYLNYDEAGNKIGDFTAKEVSDTLKNIVPTGLDDLIKTLTTNGAPAEIIQKVMSSSSLSEAYKNAGNYAAGGTGIVGEYNLYRAQALEKGQIPVDFNTYQNMDANRKKSIAAAGVAGATGLNPKQTQNFLSITTKFQADPFINNAIKGQTAIAIADQVLTNPKSAANQLKSLYVLVKNLDPDSAVREGEISLAEKTQSYLQNFQTSLTRISKGQVISESAARELAQATKELATAWNQTAQNRQKQYKAQAAGVGIADAFNEYLTTSDLQPTTSNLTQSEDQAKIQVNDFYSSANEDVQNTIDALFTKGYNNLKVAEYLKTKGLIK